MNLLIQYSSLTLPSVEQICKLSYEMLVWDKHAKIALMFKNYIASKEDLESVQKALDFASKPEMGFVFSDPSKITRTLVVSYDSKHAYVWRLGSSKLISKILHNLQISDEWQRGWWAALVSEKLRKYLPLNSQGPIISGGMLTPFITLQKGKRVSQNAYTTKESYMATIIHELGHIYFGGYGKKGELAAFCTEYYASQLFWPKHVGSLDEFIKKIKKTTPKEEVKKDPHIFAFLNAKKLITHYPKSWPQKLLK